MDDEPMDDEPMADEEMADDDGMEGADPGFEPPADEPMDEPGFEPPADEPMDEPGFEPPADEPMDEPAGDAPVDDAPADEPPADAPAGDDPFESGAIPTPGQPSRAWHDDTGRHGTVGRLVAIGPASVRILKETGRFTRVPMQRLSGIDRAHVAAVRAAAVAGARRAAADDTAGL
jgi:hypothetical protein